MAKRRLIVRIRTSRAVVLAVLDFYGNVDVLRSPGRNVESAMALVSRGHVMSFLRVKHDLTVYRKWYSYAF